MNEEKNNGIKVNFTLCKRDNSAFNNDQSKELGERIKALIDQLGYVMILDDESNTD